MSIDQQYDSLIYESGYTGHRPEYISHIMRFINNNPSLYGKFVFLLHQNVAPYLGSLLISTGYRIEFFGLSGKYRNSVKKSFSEWKMLEPFLLRNRQIRQFIFLDIDPYLILLATGKFKKFGLNVRGILFQPYIHFRGPGISSIRNLKSYLKSFAFQKYATLLNPGIKQLFVLNDAAGTKSLNRNIKDIFHFLPDPIEAKPAHFESVDTILSKFRINPEKHNLLLFGRIDRRKNLINIIDGLNLLPSPTKGKINLIIAGQFDRDIESKYLHYIEKYRDEFDVFYNNDFVTTEERDVLFQHSDLVLMPYINFYSSSGVLGHTIKNKKNVVVSNKGIVSKIVSENEIGLAVDPESPRQIKNAVYELLHNQRPGSYENQMLMEEYSPYNFSKILLGELK